VCGDRRQRGLDRRQGLAGLFLGAREAEVEVEVGANTLRVLRERGIDLSGCRSKHVGEFAGQHFDYVVSLCDRVREVCPEFPGQPELIHWSIADPAREGGSDEQSYPAFERTAAELAVRIPFLLELIEHDQPTQEVNNG
jgi:protein-tyrosine-phosphatase